MFHLNNFCTILIILYHLIMLLYIITSYHTYNCYHILIYHFTVL